MTRATTFILTLAISILFSHAYAIENEDYYNRQFCTQESGQAEYKLPDRSRIDCLTDTHAFEADSSFQIDQGLIV